MAGEDAARAAFDARWMAMWPAGNPISPVPPTCWENEAFTPPRAGDGTPLPWGRLNFRPAVEQQASLGPIGSGSTLFRSTGSLIIQLFVPANTGIGDLTKMADFAASIFRAQQFGTVTVWDCSTNIIGNRGSDSAYAQANVTARFKSDVRL